MVENLVYEDSLVVFDLGSISKPNPCHPMISTCFPGKMFVFYERISPLGDNVKLQESVSFEIQDRKSILDKVWGESFVSHVFLRSDTYFSRVKHSYSDGSSELFIEIPPRLSPGDMIYTYVPHNLSNWDSEIKKVMGGTIPNLKIL